MVEQPGETYISLISSARQQPDFQIGLDLDRSFMLVTKALVDVIEIGAPQDNLVPPGLQGIGQVDRAHRAIVTLINRQGFTRLENPDKQAFRHLGSTGLNTIGLWLSHSSSFSQDPGIKIE